MEQTEALNLARDLLAKYNIKGWQVNFNSKEKFLGLCNYNTKTIELSRKHVAEDSFDGVKETILHEIAHVITGPGHAHDIFWKKNAKSIGAKPIACATDLLKETQPEDIKKLNAPKGKYKCLICSKEGKILSSIPKFHLYKLECGHTCKFLELPKETDDWEFVSKDGKIPYPYQMEGIKFVRDSDFSCLIADEMGLGKTIQALGALKRYPDELLPVLIIVKSSIKFQWMQELLRWCGIDYLPQIIEDSKLPPVDGFNVYIASYDILRRFGKKEKKTVKNMWGHDVEEEFIDSPFYHFPFKSVILDEVQSIKGLSARTKQVEEICKGKKVIALSGTPIKNNAAEYYTILHMLSPQLFYSKEAYLRNWVEMERVNGFIKFKGISRPQEFKERTKGFIIRRTRDEVREQINLKTKVNRSFYHVDFESEKLKKLYEKAEADFIRQMEEETKNKNPMTVIAAISVMRHLVGLNKIQPTVERAKEYIEDTEDQFVIFAHHDDVRQSIVALLQKYCIENNLKEPLHYHAGLSSEERNNMIMKFRDNKDIRCMIASTLAASEGINMQFCHKAILAERQFNPANEEQAESRFIRIGQTADFVDVDYMIASGTIDEWFTDLVENKRAAINQTLNGEYVDIDEGSLLMKLMEAIVAKGRKRLTRGF